MSKEDRVRELYMDLTAAMTQFQKCLAAYIHEAEYPINYLMRDIQGKISSAEMLLDGGPRVLFRCDEWEVFMPVEGNPVNYYLLEQWESKEINKEIDYHNNQLTQLLARKRELMAKEASPLLCKSNFSVCTKLVLKALCKGHNLDYDKLTIAQFVNKFSKRDLPRLCGCGKVTLNEIADYLNSINVDWK
jgi:hypothetical protein